MATEGSGRTLWCGPEQPVRKKQPKAITVARFMGEMGLVS